MPPHDGDDSSESKRRFGTGFTQRIAIARQERLERRNEQPWIVKKLAIGIVIGLIGYSTYIYVRLCLPMIRQRFLALGSRAEGIGLLSGFCALSVMFWWTYLKLIFTSPGYARDCVPQSSVPNYRPPNERADAYWGNDNRTGTATSSSNVDNVEISDIGTPYSEMPPTPSQPGSGVGFDGRNDRVRQMSRTGSERGQTSEKTSVDIQPPSPARRSSSRRVPVPPLLTTRTYSQRSQQSQQSNHHNRHGEPAESVPLNGMRVPTNGQYGANGQYRLRSDEPSTSLDNERTLVHVPTPPSPNNMYTDPKLHPLAPKEPSPTHQRSKDRRHRSSRSKSNSNTTATSTAATFQGAGSYEESGKPAMQGRRPPSQPVLKEENRFCYRCSHVKPMRAHHCRGCGTCILMYDHHCPWIGQCVGARNIKFFINFLQWAPLFTLYIFISLLAICIRGENREIGSIDPQNIVIIALSLFFSIFTVVMLLGHLRLTSLNLTTVESLRLNDMKERERSILDRIAPVWRYRRRQAIRKEWNREWGELDTEGNIWWLGGAKRNWVARMGRDPWGWFLPIGKSEGDGLTYPINPRFTQDGTWRRRKDWPAELQ